MNIFTAHNGIEYTVTNIKMSRDYGIVARLRDDIHKEYVVAKWFDIDSKQWGSGDYYTASTNQEWIDAYDRSWAAYDNIK